jgi:type II secretory pathway pseudopilin PulG
MNSARPLLLTPKALLIKNKKNHKSNHKGSSLVELIIVTVLFAILIPISVSMFIGARKISGQAYIQHSAAVTLGETIDILRFMRNQGFDLLTDSSFYLIRNPGTNSWLTKSDVPDKDLFERYITVSNALRHEGNDDIYFDGDSGPSYEDPDTKKIVIQILWAPDYIPLDTITQTIYITNWQKIFTFIT